MTRLSFTVAQADSPGGAVRSLLCEAPGHPGGDDHDQQADPRERSKAPCQGARRGTGQIRLAARQRSRTDEMSPTEAATVASITPPARPAPPTSRRCGGRRAEVARPARLSDTARRTI